MRTGLELWARRAGVRVDVVDDGSKPERAARIHEELIARGYRFVLGPYGSDCTRKVAEARAGSVVWNHGAAADDVQRLPGVVSVATPASRYLVALGRAVAELRPRSGSRSRHGAGAIRPSRPRRARAGGRLAGDRARLRPRRGRGSAALRPAAVGVRASAIAYRFGKAAGWPLSRSRCLPRTSRGRSRGGARPCSMASRPRTGGGARACVRSLRRLHRGAGLRRCADRRPLPRAQPLRPARSRAYPSHDHLLRRLRARRERPPDRPSPVSRVLAIWTTRAAVLGRRLVSTTAACRARAGRHRRG